MKKLRIILPAIAFTLAIAGGFAQSSLSGTAVLAQKVTQYDNGQTCLPCANGELNCQTVGSIRCQCFTTMSDGYYKNTAGTCIALFRP